MYKFVTRPINCREGQNFYTKTFVLASFDGSETILIIITEIFDVRVLIENYSAKIKDDVDGAG